MTRNTFVLKLQGELNHPKSFGSFEKRAPVSQKSRNFSGLFQVLQFPLYLRIAEVLSHQTLQSSSKRCQKISLSKRADCSFTTGFSDPKSSRALYDKQAPGFREHHDGRDTVPICMKQRKYSYFYLAGFAFFILPINRSIFFFFS